MHVKGLSLIKDRQRRSGTIAREADNRNIMSSQRAFARAFLVGLRIIWPVLSGLLAIIVGAGLLIGWMEDWSLWHGVYFASVTALGIGYGDFSPTRHLTQALAILLGVTGIRWRVACGPGGPSADVKNHHGPPQLTRRA
jgi:hypothetical protein